MYKLGWLAEEIRKISGIKTLCTRCGAECEVSVIYYCPRCDKDPKEELKKLKEKLKDAKNHLMHNELLYIHINALDEGFLNGNIKGKVKIIERIDNEIAGPILEFRNERFEDRYRIAVLSGHYTLLEDGSHLGKPAPYALYGKNIEKDGVMEFSEKEIEEKNKNVIKSYEFLDFVVEQDN